MTKKFKPSKEQTNIFKFILEDNKNAVISAVAGSGKTTTLIQSLELIPNDKSILFMAFNKSIANELKDRVPKDKMIDVRTVHSFGFSLLGGYIIDNNKYRKILKDIIDYSITNNNHLISQYNFNQESLSYVKKILVFINDKLEIDDFVSDVLSLSNLNRLSLVNFEDETNGIEETKKLSRQYSVTSINNESNVAWYLSKIGLSFDKSIDYTDMICLPIILDLPTPQYDFVYIDECQDLNTCQRLLMQKAMKPETGRFIAVGDPKQSIYGFAGADHESYQKLKNIPNTIELPLSCTYRCLPKIVETVKDINPKIISYKKDKSGSVIESFSYKDIKDGDMVLCRNTFPVVSLCVRLLSEGKKSFIIGSDIGLSLKTLIKKQQRKSEEFNMENVFSRLYNEKEKMVEKIMSTQRLSNSEANDENSVILFNEKIQVIEALSYNTTDPNMVIKKIDELFSDTKKTGICLSNIHKSKGLEAERVFILHKELMPSKYSKLPWELEQERNLQYVAYTRAKSCLGFITDYDAWGKHQSKKDEIKEVKNSEFIGVPGEKRLFKLKVLDVREINTKFGETLVYDMVDENNNLVSKMGEIKSNYITNGKMNVEKGAELSFRAFINEHITFKGDKITRLGRISNK